ncbi:MAG: protein-L-isoaspartate(D-aspartate) O-methyltransferase [Pseudomonadota bacterium]
MDKLLIQGVGMTSQRTRNRLVDELRKMGIKNDEVLQVISTTPRHLFMEEALASRAYENISLPIGHGQTISQPYIVAKMTELILEGFNPRRVLEVGTGSGYQTAVLSPLFRSVFTVERIAPLLDKAKKRFRELRLNNILCDYSDGNWGWPTKAPFDAIIVTAAPEKLPPSLLEQLAEDGRLVIPVGRQGKQGLYLYKREGDKFINEHLEDVSFVPLLAGKS